MAYRETIPTADVDTRRLALEVIVTLAAVKRVAADLILRPVGILDILIRRFLDERDATTNDPLTERQAGALILEVLAHDDQGHTIVRRLIELASKWDAFHLAHDEYKARTFVQKTQELTRFLSAADAQSRSLQKQAAELQALYEKRERERNVREQSDLLLAQFDHASIHAEPHERGYLLQDLLNRAFDLYGIPITRSYQRNSGGEQIDGAFEMDGWHYIVECRWRSRLANIRELDGLYGQVSRSGRQTMGLFLSINGWSDNVVPLMKQNPDKSVILMEGVDLRTVLARACGLRKLLKAKVAALNLEAEPFLPVSRLTAGTLRLPR